MRKNGDKKEKRGKEENRGNEEESEGMGDVVREKVQKVIPPCWRLEYGLPSVGEGSGSAVADLGSAVADSGSAVAGSGPVVADSGSFVAGSDSAVA